MASYPEFGCFPKKQVDVWTGFGISNCLLNFEESTFKFLFDVFDEVIELFPFEYIHIGGDEVPVNGWKNSEIMENFTKNSGV